MGNEVTGIGLFVVDVNKWSLHLVSPDPFMSPLIGIQCSICQWVEWYPDEDKDYEMEPTLRDLLELAQNHKHKEGAFG